MQFDEDLESISQGLALIHRRVDGFYPRPGWRPGMALEDAGGAAGGKSMRKSKSEPGLRRGSKQEAVALILRLQY